MKSAVDSRERLLELIREQSYMTGDFTLASGRKSTFFLDLKNTLLDAEGSALAADAVLDLIANDKAEAVGGLELGACPIASSVCTRSYERGMPVKAFYVRKQPKERGTNKVIEGPALKPGARVVVVEDVSTTGNSALEAVQKVRDAGLEVVRVVTILDRLQGAKETFGKAGVVFTPVFTLKDLGL
jgi:orotate phosphoribosyltransferase